jgi:hypothetical protein
MQWLVQDEVILAEKTLVDLKTVFRRLNCRFFMEPGLLQSV